MNKRIWLLVGIILATVLIVATGVFLLANKVDNIFKTSTTTPTASGTISPAPSTTTTRPTSSTLPPISGAPAPSKLAGVSFNVISVENTSTFSRTITGKLTNDGTIDLHNSKLKIEMFSNAKPMNINKQPFWENSYATIAASKSITDVLTLNLGLADGLTVNSNGAHFIITFTSDELTRTFTYDYQP